MSNEKYFIASIPFVRNLIEYTSGTNDINYAKLTSLLHKKSITDSVTISDIKNIFENILKETKIIESDKKVLELIYEVSDKIILDTVDTINLENKIILSIACRIKMEEYMIEELYKIGAQSDVRSIVDGTKDQTISLYKLYKNKGLNRNLDLIEQLNLMTPENIHINSFMFEPILDTSEENLHVLYKKIKEL